RGKPITVWIGAVLLLASLNCSEAQIIRTYFEVGGNLTLRPTVTETITNILWRYNGNLLAEWVKNEVDLLYYDKYKGRTTLNTATGQLEINNMEKHDVGMYTVEINYKVHSQSYEVRWITRVTTTKYSTVTSGQTETEPIKTVSCRMKNPVSQEDKSRYMVFSGCLLGAYCSLTT
uniref:Immunoglobulin V-set domain-containing protein n=1 Tax=Sparus aurata TaxID=8175 RepID=A0A671W3N5_SPAAU